MKKNIIISVVVVILLITGFITYANKSSFLLGGTIFNSGQVGSGAANLEILQTNGTVSTWVSTTTLGIAGGSQTPWSSTIDGGGFALSNTGLITATRFTATSSVASILPYASTTMITATIASSSKFIGIGSQSLPAYTFSGDEDTGMYRSGANTIDFSVGGVGTMTLDSIRLTLSAIDISNALTGTYEIKGTSAGTVSLPTYTFGGDEDTGLWRQAANTISLTAGGTEVFRSAVATTSFPVGSIGIGTSTPKSKLHVSNGLNATTTVDFAAESTTSKTCFNTRNTTGDPTSFYFVGTIMVVEAKKCL